MTSLRSSITVLAAAALLGACSSVKLDETKAPVETRTPEPTTATAPGAGAGEAAPQSQVATVDLSKNAAAQAAGPRVVYFDFDSFVVKDEYRPLMETQAKTLNGNRQKKLVIEGHTDERGGREYNLALGQKRAEAVVKSLKLLGAQDTQIEAVSFGEERPAAQGATEEAWAKNRRAELKDR